MQLSKLFSLLGCKNPFLFPFNLTTPRGSARQGKIHTYIHFKIILIFETVLLDGVQFEMELYLFDDCS